MATVGVKGLKALSRPTEVDVMLMTVDDVHVEPSLSAVA